MSTFDKPVCPAPPILHLPDVSKASGVRVPGAVDGAHGVDGGAPGAREGALLSKVTLGAVPGDAGAHTGDLRCRKGMISLSSALWQVIGINACSLHFN